MGDLSALTPPKRHAVTIGISSCWYDHRFQGRAVLPAVAAMQLLADWVGRFRPGLAVRRMGRAAFDKFLELPGGDTAIDAYCDLTDLPEGGVRIGLLTRSRSGTAGITRYKTHAQVDFLPAVEPCPILVADSSVLSDEAGFIVDPSRIYSELVPFGPAFHNIIQPLVLNPRGAQAVLQAPGDYPAGSLGSPFVLDAAFHAACVWGQRFAGVVAFPVGLAQRLVVQPARPGGTYMSRVWPAGREKDTLLFDLWIQAPGGRWVEHVRGVRMRDVSGGRWTPPAWIRSSGEEHLGA